jgi:hypothetical protein
MHSEAVRLVAEQPMHSGGAAVHGETSNVQLRQQMSGGRALPGNPSKWNVRFGASIGWFVEWIVVLIDGLRGLR